MYTLATPNKSDYPTLLAIWEASVRATHHFLHEGAVEFFKKIIQENEVFDQVKLTVVRDADPMILGFMGVSEHRLEMLFLAPEARGKGIGKILLRHAIDNLGITHVDVNEQNGEALKFYEKAGFRVISRSELDGTGKPYPILHMQLPA
ncbi:GNAT family N-acetyltransferase [Cytophagaceae bacterium SJW1-29]|uniref:GNAT family N-acetyltransferase n=2 Tax=Salmonirosea aquatica TaxID=2654236 RepID=A0A7C9FB99_9BACT|nr:GNAT family N-acetyltransferase [Cytophagaceae bacterium SJW1-29]